MALSDVFASNVLVRWLRGDPGRYALLTSLIGARLGDRLLSFGAGDPGLVAAIAKVVGLSGRAVAHAATPQDAARLVQSAEAAGVLVDVDDGPHPPLPYPDGDFDLVLVDAVSAPVALLLPEIRRVLRTGGRVVLVVRQKVPQAPAPEEIRSITSAHFKGARVLYERDGLAIVEALKGQTPAS